MDDKILEKIDLLKSLLDEGIISQEEFDAKKKALFDSVAETIDAPEMEEEEDAVKNEEKLSMELPAGYSASYLVEEEVPEEPEEPTHPHEHTGISQRKIVIIVAVIAIIFGAIFIFNHKNNSIWSYSEDGKLKEEVYNRWNSVYYYSSYGQGKTIKLFPNSKTIDVTFLSYVNGKLQSRTLTKPVSDFIDINYKYNGWSSPYDFDIDTYNGLVYMTNENKPLEALVYVMSTKQYYHVSSYEYDGNFYIQDQHYFDSPLLKQFLSTNQLQLFNDRNWGRQYRVVSIDRDGKVELQNRRGFYYENRKKEARVFAVSLEGATEEERDKELITEYLLPMARTAEAESFFDKIAVLDNDYLKGLARNNSVKANREYANGEFWFFIIEATNISSGYSGYTYEVYEYGGFQVLTNDSDFAKIGYPANLIIRASVSSVSSDGIHYLKDAELLGVESSYGITTYDGIYLENQHVQRVRRDW